MNTQINFKVTDILNDLGIEYKQVGRDNYRIKCINPYHHETRPSMSIHKDTGVIFCFGCKFKGNIFTLLKRVGFDYRAIKPYLKKFIVGGDSEEERLSFLENFINSRMFNLDIDSTITVELPPNKLIDSHNFYLEEVRGLTKEEIRKWNMGVVTSGKYISWVLIPIYQNNILVNYFLRDSFGSGKMYGPYPRKDILFGIDQMNDFNRPIYITEGIFDSIFVQRTRNQCVAALSNDLLPDQLNKLKRYSKIVIVPDNDEQGYHLVEAAYQLIHKIQNIFVCELPKNKKDAAMCSLEELLESTYNEIPIIKYMLRKKYGTSQCRIVQSI